MPNDLLADEEALAWLQNQPGRRLETSISELATVWRWGRTRVYRRLERWEHEGRIAKSGTIGGRWLITVVSDNPIAPDNAVAAPACTSSAGANRVDIEKSQELGPKLSGPVPSGVRQTVRRPDDQVHAGGRLARTVSSVVLGAIALAIAWFGIRINAWYGATLGRTAEASLLLAGLSVAADILALVLPAVSRQLWLDRQRSSAAVAWGLWMFTAAIALLASIGFASLNIADVQADRAKTASAVERLTGRVEQLRTARLVIHELRSVAEIDAQIQITQPGAAAVWKATAGCTDVTQPRSGEACARILALRESRGEATRRDAIDAELRDVGLEIRRLPAVTLADPQADTAARLARWFTAGLVRITSDDVAMARVAGMAFLPQIGGLVMMLAMALSRRAQVRQPLHPRLSRTV
jgi:hypothetical protein